MRLAKIFLFLLVTITACKSVDETQQTPQALSISGNVLLTSEATPDSEVLHFIQLGDTLEVLDQTERGYMLVRTNQGLEGWVDNKFISFGNLQRSGLSAAHTGHLIRRLNDRTYSIRWIMCRSSPTTQPEIGRK